MINSRELDVIILDPFYMMLIGENNKRINPNDMFAMGQTLGRLADVCRDAGATPILVHHFGKNSGRPGAAPELGNLAHSGIGQFVRSWMLLSRRERFVNGQDIHRLHLVVGGSSGYSSHHELDIDRTPTADEPDGRWHVTMTEATHKGGQGRASKKDADAGDRQRLLEVIAEGPALSARKLRDVLGWNQTKVARLVGQLSQEGLVVESVSKPGSRSATSYSLTADGLAKAGQKS